MACLSSILEELKDSQNYIKSINHPRFSPFFLSPHPIIAQKRDWRKRYASFSLLFFPSWGRRYPPYLCHYLAVLFPPGCRGTAFLLFEHTIEVGAGRKTAFGRNDVVAEVGIFQNHLLGCFKPHFGKPDAESGVEGEREIPRQFGFGNVQRTRQGDHVQRRIFVTLLGTPDIQLLADDFLPFCRKRQLQSLSIVCQCRALQFKTIGGLSQTFRLTAFQGRLLFLGLV